MKNREAFIWSAFEKFGCQIINFVVILILARLLTPANFGLVSILISITYILNIFVEGGFGSYIIQSNNLKLKEVDTIFTTSLVLHGLLL